MKIKHKDIFIPIDNPFANCKLDRKVYAEVLTNIIKFYSDGFVLAINNEWGTGKTTFVKMWKQHLANEGYITLYFNAWENDFDENPLVALLSELEILTTSSNKESFKLVLQKGSILARNILPALLKSIIKKYIGADIIPDTIKDTAQGMSEIFEEEIKEYSNKKKSVEEFKIELEKFIRKSDNTSPLIFIIDELDRCRPNYAVKVLEQIKHLFSVSGIIFILSIDKAQLGYAIKGVYGNDHINSDEYLRRFIDIEYSIPAPSIDSFCNYLYDYYSFDDFFESSVRKSIAEFQSDKIMFLKIAIALFQKTNANLRLQEKVLSYTRIVLDLFDLNTYIFPSLLFFLIYIKITKPNLYSKIDNNTISLQELSDEYGNLIPDDLRSSSGVNLLYLESLLLYFYSNQCGYKEGYLYKKNDDGKLISIVKSKLDDSLNNDKLSNYIYSLSYKFETNDIKISYLLKKINLIDSIALR